MDWPSQCAVVIPCLNEAGTIAPLVRDIRKQLSAVIVVDDGSSDETGRRAAEAGAEVIRHGAPQGKGAALKAGWRRAAERGFAWALCLDGDDQHATADIGKFLACAGQGRAALVVGNRMTGEAKMPWMRRQVNRWMSRRLSRVAGCELPDTQCGFRLMRLDVWRQLKLHTNHFEIESELLLAFVAAGQSVEFVPIQVIYKTEQSKISPWRDTGRWFRWLRAREARQKRERAAPRLRAAPAIRPSASNLD